MNTPIAMILSQKGSAVYSVAPGATVAEAVQLMSEHEVGSLVATHAGRVLGLVTLRQVMSGVILSGRVPEFTTVGEIMIRNPATISLRATVGDALEQFTDLGCKYLIVTEGDTGELAGILSSGDVMRLVADAHRAEATHMRQYLSGCCF